jgi:DNA-binding GntR family transcriptional regulator
VTARLSPPRYERIANSLKERIAADEFEDCQLPSIDRLCSDYAVGRQTVTRALGILVQDGVVRRRTGHTYVATPWGETRASVTGEE